MYVLLFVVGFLFGFLCSIGGCLVILKERDEEESLEIIERYEDDKEVKPWL